MFLLIESELKSEARLAAGRDRISVACENDTDSDSGIECEARLVAEFILNYF